MYFLVYLSITRLELIDENLHCILMRDFFQLFILIYIYRLPHTCKFKFSQIWLRNWNVDTKLSLSIEYYKVYSILDILYSFTNFPQMRTNLRRPDPNYIQLHISNYIPFFSSDNERSCKLILIGRTLAIHMINSS
jgi:hypothetical protein